MHFVTGNTPLVEAFWSVTMFGAKRCLVENPIHRYAMGSRTEGLHYNPDGSLDVFIQAVAPPGKTSNLLPCPRGPLLVTMRLYLLKPEVLNGEYKIPPVLCTDCFNAGSAAPGQSSLQQHPRAKRFGPSACLHADSQIGGSFTFTSTEYCTGVPGSDQVAGPRVIASVLVIGVFHESCHWIISPFRRR